MSIKEIKIYGTLIIKNDEEIHLTYTNLLFGHEGKIVIIQDPTKSITLEQTSSQEQCDPKSLILGSLEIQQQQQPKAFQNQIQINNIISGSNSIILPQLKLDNLNLKEILFIKFDSGSVSREEFSIIAIHEDTIILNGIIKNDYISYDNAFLPQFRLVLKTGQIVFKKQKKIYLIYFFIYKIISNHITNSSCLSITTTDLIGISFLNIKYLSLTSTNVQNCIFQGENNQNFNIFLHGNFINNILQDFSGSLQILKSDGSLAFDNNLILNSEQVNIINPMYYYNNTHVNSTVSIRSQNDDNQQTIGSIILQRSLLYLYFEHSEDIELYQFTLIQSQLSIINSIKILTITDTKILDSTFILEQITHSLRIYQSYFYHHQTNKQISQIVCKKNQPKNININNTVIIGDMKYFIEQILQDDTPEVQNKTVIISLQNTTFKVNQMQNNNISSLFSLYQQLFQYKTNYDNVYTQINVENYNLDYPHLLPPKMFSLPENQQMTLHPPSYYDITKISFSEYYESFGLLLKQNGKIKELMNLPSNKIQIMSNQIQEIIFYTTNRVFIDAKRFDFTLYKNIQHMKTNYFGKYSVTIQYQSQPIKKAFVYFQNDTKGIDFMEIPDDNNKEIYVSDNIFVKKNQILNQINIYWSQLHKNNITLTFDLILCEKGHFLQEGKCVEQCNNKASGYYCSEKCENGYFELNDSSCYPCPYGCYACEEPQSCQICFPQFNMNKGKCVDVCDKNQYQFYQKCFDCQLDCSICSDSILTDEIHARCQDCELIKRCNDLYYECHSSCHSCTGQHPYDCLICKADYIDKFGLCAK